MNNNLSMIRALRKNQNLSMKELGSLIGVSESTISLYENGKRQPDYDTLIKISNYFNVSIDFLLGNSRKSHDIENRIRELRQDHGITQIELAKFLGIAQNTLSYWEQGKYDIDNTSLRKIADYFNCSIDYILCRTEAIRQGREDHFEEEHLSNHEKQLVSAYRNQPDMQSAVDRLLNIHGGATVHFDNSAPRYIAAHGEDSKGGGVTHFSKEELKKLRSAPKTDEDF